MKKRKIYCYWEVDKDVFKEYKDLTHDDINKITSKLKREIKELNKELKERLEMLKWLEEERALKN